jgi:protein-tyrosine-phosphatase/predicted ATP-grasp superfamily ATP-dependent carboligase
MAKALILGDDTRAFLSVVRSLGRQGISVDVIPGHWASPALRSRYIHQTLRLTDMNLDPAAWQADLVAAITTGNYDFILPCTDSMVVAMQLCREQLPTKSLAMVSRPAFDVLFDKINTRELAAICNVPVAMGRQLQQKDDAATLVQEFGLPLAIKSRSSVFEHALGRRHAVAICRNIGQVKDALARIEQPEDFLAEALFSGGGLGISILANQGRVLQAFQHIRVNESLAGKGSYYRKSVPLDAALLGYVEAICAKTALTGLAMFEFCRNRTDGKTILLEVNARPWGSLPLAIAAGVDFPYLYYRLLVDGVEEPCRAVTTGVYCRNVTADANSLIDTLSSFSLGTPKMAVAANITHRIIGLWRLAVGRDKVDVAATDDPAPATADWADYWQAWRNRLEPRISMLGRYFRRQEQRRFAQLAANKDRLRKILVLCRGNICRSPYAEVRLAQMLGERGLSIVVTSAGTLPQPGRTVPVAGLEAAKKAGMDLTKHRSTYVAQIDLSTYDLVVHFDPIIEFEYRKLVGFDAPPLFNLAYFNVGSSPSSQIKDPIDKPVDYFSRTYQAIDLALEQFVNQIPRAM